MNGRRTDAGAAVAGLFARSTATGGLATREPAPAPSSMSASRTLRQCVELLEEEVSYLRGLSRPDRTGQPRSHGSKFVATGVLMAAVELLSEVEVDMWGVEAGDVEAMKARARAALIAAGARQSEAER
ncbi:hypothetical protein DVA67_011970 [Solirubrobacter sp. CPCC 204708]|uniref:Uncharacterized protein n=1 Tax=Solirubrobacter deserti TaxID=2282478 RepID=A0ABT4RLK4_9ACTN|nr:hypothetical protein [Solirubrobacter deserti]MBE2316694.1 hypothetical protein [Solirubrobacter deserti]MDA0139451.1 hypothetical protein [Solirubrobacter deserti]